MSAATALYFGPSFARRSSDARASSTAEMRRLRSAEPSSAAVQNEFRRSSIRSEDRWGLRLDGNALRAQLRRRLLHDLARFVGEPRGIIDVPLVLSHRSAQDSVLRSAKESKAVQYRRQSLVERPLSPRDYDMPVGWWGWKIGR